MKLINSASNTGIWAKANTGTVRGAVFACHFHSVLFFFEIYEIQVLSYLTSPQDMLQRVVWPDLIMIRHFTLVTLETEIQLSCFTIVVFLVKSPHDNMFWRSNYFITCFGITRVFMADWHVTPVSEAGIKMGRDVEL